jgi:hypothetical protein
MYELMGVNGLNQGCPPLGKQVVSMKVFFHAFLLFEKKKWPISFKNVIKSAY